MLPLQPTQEGSFSRLRHLPELGLKQFQVAVGSGAETHNTIEARTGPSDPDLEQRRKLTGLCLQA